ncbi:hypothetical protein [Nocardia rhizosphaerae]|uniref:Uncharacterized protein n=1 Tax=Nocardia rhizosphaerae TaxID=1691571 RepID=A0ABV8LCG5_9NOCA
MNYREKRKRALTVVDAIVGAGGRASAIGADVSDPAAVRALADEIDPSPSHRRRPISQLITTLWWRDFSADAATTAW